MLTVVGFKNNLTKTYTPWVFREDDYEDYRRRLHDTMLVNPDEVVKQNLHLMTVFLVGYYDLGTGQLQYADDPQEYDLAEAFKQLEALRNSVHAN